MSKKAGWYKDPWPGPPDGPPLLRYWDGRHWTEHARTAEEVTQPAYAATGYGGASAPDTAYAGTAMAAATPDGQLLAGYWQRVWAYLLDSLIVGLVGGLLASPWIGDVIDAFGQFMDQAVRDAEAGVTTDPAAFQQAILGPIMVISLIFLVVGFVYHVGFLMALQATPGKLALGLRVRLRDRPGPMPIGTVLLRWAGQFGYAILNLVPIAGSLAGIYSLLDHLWPAWDGKKQAIHDKIARTNVVRSR
jgi:uncharacterized RDD family membrane protein YckC